MSIYVYTRMCIFVLQCVTDMPCNMQHTLQQPAICMCTHETYTATTCHRCPPASRCLPSLARPYLDDSSMPFSDCRPEAAGAVVGDEHEQWCSTDLAQHLRPYGPTRFMCVCVCVCVYVRMCVCVCVFVCVSE